MTLTVGRPVRIFALVALLAVLGGAGTLLLPKKHSAAPPIVEPAAPARAHPHAAVPAKTATKAPPVQKKQPAALFAANGLPMPLAKALRAHRVVVVSLYDPQSQTDAFSFGEARAGAAEAHVGFLGVSLLDNRVASPLTAILPSGQILPEPGLLIYRRPGTLVQRIDGFVDRDIVAQAAVGSLSGPPLAGAGS